MILGFLGPIGVGKSTACNYVKEKHANFVQVNFKDALVGEVEKCLPDVVKWIQKDLGVEKVFDIKPRPPLVRALLQNFGTELRRGDDPEYWCKRWKEEVMRQSTLGKNVITDDVRFLNEEIAVHELGGVLIRLKRPDVEVAFAHASEVETTQIVADYEIVSRRDDYPHLFSSIDKIVEVQLEVHAPAPASAPRVFESRERHPAAGEEGQVTSVGDGPILTEGVPHEENY